MDKNICTKFYGKMYHGHATMTTSPNVETDLMINTLRYQMNVQKYVDLRALKSS